MESCALRKIEKRGPKSLNGDTCTGGYLQGGYTGGPVRSAAFVLRTTDSELKVD